MPHLHASFSDRRALRDSGSAAQSTAQPLRTPTCTCHTRQHPSGGPARGKGEVKGKGGPLGGPHQRAGKQRAVNTACTQYLQYTSGNELYLNPVSLGRAIQSSALYETIILVVPICQPFAEDYLPCTHYPLQILNEPYRIWTYNFGEGGKTNSN